MEVRFSWGEFNGRYIPGCECIGGSDEYDYLGCLLTDDGGLGLDYHIPSLRQVQEMCRNILNGHSEVENFTTECFAADILGAGVWIYDNRSDPTTGIKYRLESIVQVLDSWIEFLENGARFSGGHFSIQVEF